MLNINTYICRSESAVFTSIDGEIVMMDIESGAYYNLNSVATRIWELIEKPVSIGDICKHLIEDFDVSPQDCEEKTISFIHNLISKNIVIIFERS